MEEQEILHGGESSGIRIGHCFNQATHDKQEPLNIDYNFCQQEAVPMASWVTEPENRK